MKPYKVILGCLHIEVINALYDKGIDFINDKSASSLITKVFATDIFSNNDQKDSICLTTLSPSLIFKVCKLSF